MISDLNHLHFLKLSVEGIDAAREQEIEVEVNDLILALENKFYEGLRSVEKYELACEIGEKESLQNVVRESFEKATKVVQAMMKAEDVDNFKNIAFIADAIEISKKKLDVTNGERIRRRKVF